MFHQKKKKMITKQMKEKQIKKIESQRWHDTSKGSRRNMLINR